MRHTKGSRTSWIEGTAGFAPLIKLGLGLIFLVALVVLGNQLETTAVGLIALTVYLFYALIFKVPSVTAFQWSLAALLLTFFANALNLENGLGETFAIYAYVLLVIGVFLTCIEQWQDRHKSTIIKNKTEGRP